MKIYSIRPDLSTILFDSEDSAKLYVSGQKSYVGLSFWYAANHDGKFRAYCDHPIKINEEDLENFPQPYKIILCDD